MDRGGYEEQSSYVLFNNKREGDEDMKRTYKLTEKQKKAALRYYKKGITTQGKLARKLKVSKQKVASFLKTKKIGKRAKQPFWRDVKSTMEMKEVSRAKAIKEVKYSPKWFKKRQARLSGIKKARDEIGRNAYMIRTGEVPDDWFETEEGVEMMEYAGYD